MKIKKGANIQGLHIVMRKALIVADKIYKQFGRREGVTITSGLDGTHSAGSVHYYGFAVDIRTYYWNRPKIYNVKVQLKLALGRDYDVIIETNHIHIEYNKYNKYING